MRETMPHLIFDTIVVAIMGGVVVSALAWPFQTSLFPLVIGVPLLLLGLFQLGKDARNAVTGISDLLEQSQTTIVDVPTEQSIPTSLVIKRAGGFSASTLGLFLLVTLIGFHAAVPIYLIGYLRFYARAGWFLILLMTSAIMILMVGVFDQLLNVPWPEPLIGFLFIPATD